MGSIDPFIRMLDHQKVELFVGRVASLEKVSLGVVFEVPNAQAQSTVFLPASCRSTCRTLSSLSGTVSAFMMPRLLP